MHGELAHRARILGGVPVWGTVPGSAADHLGLRGGDILLRVNGVQLQTPDDFLAARRPWDESLELAVLRAESLLRINVPTRQSNDQWIDELGQQVFGRDSWLPRSP